MNEQPLSQAPPAPLRTLAVFEAAKGVLALLNAGIILPNLALITYVGKLLVQQRVQGRTQE